MTPKPGQELAQAPFDAPAFKCLRCGQCCRGRGGTWLNYRQVRSLAEFLGEDLNRVIENYLEKDPSAAASPPGKDESFEAGLWNVGVGPKGHCLFFDPGARSCLIHPVKPLSCQRWPYYRWPLTSRDGFLEAQSHCPGLAAFDFETFARAFKATGLGPTSGSFRELTRQLAIS
ncbi:MAG: YkgJ family cysteine cluster protein [Deltaproteobacteria bacterium]|nr:YkgJ family cysteine cluster protein [Deltaproteobacteria bacterium]